MINKDDVLLELSTVDFPLYMVVPDTETTSKAVRLTTKAEADMVIRTGTPVGRTPLEAARNTYNAACGQLLLRADAAGISPGRLLQRIDGANKLLPSLVRMRNLIATLEAEETNDNHN